MEEDTRTSIHSTWHNWHLLTTCYEAKRSWTTQKASSLWQCTDVPTQERSGTGTATNTRGAVQYKQLSKQSHRVLVYAEWKGFGWILKQQWQMPNSRPPRRVWAKQLNIPNSFLSPRKKSSWKSPADIYRDYNTVLQHLLHNNSSDKKSKSWTANKLLDNRQNHTCFKISVIA